jgi:serine protease Do
MPNSQIKWPLLMALIVVLVLAGLAETQAQKAQGWAGAARDSHGPRFGLTVSELTPSILRALGLPSGTQGVVVSDVESGSIAEEAGLRMGDIIQEVNRKPVANIREYAKAMQGVDTMVMFLINRKGEHVFVALEGPAEPAR